MLVVAHLIGAEQLAKPQQVKLTLSMLTVNVLKHPLKCSPLKLLLYTSLAIPSTNNDKIVLQRLKYISCDELIAL